MSFLARPPHTARTIAAIAIGNTLEWFDLAIYAFFAVYIAGNFFPMADETTSLLLTFGSFGASYLMRPLGGLILGSYADRHGRKAALLLSLWLMSAGTALIALLPNYHVIGLAAPIGLFCARLIQGFSSGGEFGACTAMLFEQAPNKRGLHASWQFSTQGLGSLGAALMGFALSHWLTPHALMAWGWRIPFAVGSLLGPVGWYLRRTLHDAPAFIQAPRAAAPVREVLGHYRPRLAIVAGLLSVTTTLAYLLQYMPTFALRTLHLSAATGFAAAIVPGALSTLLTPLGGWLSDRLGPVRQMSVAAMLCLVSAWPAFTYAAAHPSARSLFLLVTWLGLIKALYSGALPLVLAALFPMPLRATGIALGYNVGVMVFGASAPAIVVWLASVTGQPGAPGLYVMLTAAISLSALAGLAGFDNGRHQTSKADAQPA
ncbi:MFS transporter [Paraburkholderia hayleyella]|uniref:MFS transporter n=1 Tax=Paraburkholderia hayleyella TaxID=2152889 RepID=UPI00129291AB|nr:MFS transporter [Paraburkholderia hayleyella]